MDRNTIIGAVLILAMLVAYQMLLPKPTEPQPVQTEQVIKATPKKAAASPATSQPLDSVALKARFGTFAQAATGTAQDVVLENKDVKVTLSSLGGRVKQVQLKNYKTFDGKPLLLLDAQRNETALELANGAGRVDVHKLYFEKNATSPLRATFTLNAGGQIVEQTYTLAPEGFVVDYDLKVNTVTGDARFAWQDRMAQFENDMAQNRQSAQITYLTADESFEETDKSESSWEGTVEQPVQWFSIKHKYFLASLIAKNSPMTGATFKTLVDPADSTTVKTAIAGVNLPAADLKAGKGNFRFYFGPADYQVVKEGVAPEFGQNVYLGYSILKPLNRFFFVPMFNLLEKVISNYGLLIVVLVVLVKLLLTPLTYKSYVSMAKMRVLTPEINAIKERVGEDMTKQQQEQMKLYQEVGVSPLSGCIPVLATMPILLALFQLFPNLIELRQKSFLWSNDLSTYDAIINWPVAIPFVGSHLSLFTVLMTASSLAYAYYNNQITPAQPNSPVNMKALGYIFPLMFMFVLNSFPAGLTWYYFVSNVVTIAQQLLIRKFVDEDAIKAKLDENRRKNATGEVKKSKFQTYLQKSLQAAEEARKQADDAKQRASDPKQRSGKGKK